MPRQTEPLRRTYEALRSINVDALISIGGDDTLKTANKFKRFQELLPEPNMPVVHLPKTIDNDYHGIDFTFGFFTAVEFLASEIRNLIYDAEVTKTYFIAETMGRSAGWLSYGAAIAGDASLVISVEDIMADYLIDEHIDEGDAPLDRQIMDIDRVVERIVKTMIALRTKAKSSELLYWQRASPSFFHTAMSKVWNATNMDIFRFPRSIFMRSSQNLYRRLSRNEPADHEKSKDCNSDTNPLCQAARI